MKKKSPSKSASQMSVGRRKFMKGAAAAGGLALGSGVVTGFPTIKANEIKNITLRQFGTGVSNINEIAKKVKEDLGLLGDDRSRHRHHRTTRGHPAEILRHRRYRVFHG